MNRVTRKVSSGLGTIIACSMIVACGDNGAPEANDTNAADGSDTNAVAPAEAALTAGDPAAGERLFTQCASCHSLVPGDHRTGPSLAQIVGTQSGSVDGFDYSPASRSSDITWTEETLNAFIENPRETIPGTRMIFLGISDPQDRADLIAFLAKAD